MSLEAVPLPKGAKRFVVVFFIFATIALLHEINTKLIPILPEGLLREASVNLSEQNIRQGELYTVTRVLDGDTLTIDYYGTQEKVRLLGINTPETVDPRKPVECFGKEASDYLKNIAEGEKVTLEFDGTQDLRDKYDRLLAYAYLKDGQMINRKMITDGYAYEYTYEKPYKYKNDFKKAQGFAKTNERGLWNKENGCHSQ